MPRLNLYTREPVGPADAPLVVLGPALGAPASMWDGVAARLAPDYRTVTFEHFGFNGAPVVHEAFTISDLADAVVRVIDDVGAQRAFFAGDSISGAVALELALRHPDRVAAVAAVCSVARTASDPSMAPLAAAVRNEGTVARAADVGDRWFAPGAAETRGAEIDALVASLVGADDETYARYLDALDAHEIGERLAEIDVPVLSIWSEFDLGDAEGKMRFIAEGVQRGTLVGIEGAGHVPPLEQPEAVADAFRSFFRTER
ncbi:alpha/beta fold hydrolase [Agromyces aerolatus]|uniref:alpha/beta fold hydrolase n=1 Tax=Agromyces sp. LY-1074 TaxID=3074080 RepID=UPI00285853FD|nr:MULTISPECIES: alpha/beta fold hydrolase [unclassified Agromyces]MDR5701584.1 alpha/beta fold hydrolase [Agromyces sp. LY-1074]MDR5706114.1 alpha/beta fold hydrolase [Agromyces sp. LY-1358]